jgi:hypothetical protein
MLCTFSGNAVTTIKSNDKVKVFTVRGTSFEPAPLDGGGAAQENGTSWLYRLKITFTYIIEFILSFSLIGERISQQAIAQLAFLTMTNVRHSWVASNSR